MKKAEEQIQMMNPSWSSLRERIKARAKAKAKARPRIKREKARDEESLIQLSCHQRILIQKN